MHSFWLKVFPPFYRNFCFVDIYIQIFLCLTLNFKNGKSNKTLSIYRVLKLIKVFILPYLINKITVENIFFVNGFILNNLVILRRNSSFKEANISLTSR